MRPSLRLLGAALAAAALAGCGAAGDTSVSVTVTGLGHNRGGGLPQSSTGDTPAAVTPAPPASSLPPPADRCASASFGPPLAPSGAPADVHTYPAPPAMQVDTAKLYEATISTAKGAIVICLDPRLAPMTVNNFVVLSRNHFYDGLIFHRVVPDFVIQGGDPTGSGAGGPGYQFADEPVRAAYTVGAVAMANAGPNTNGSQFFICIGAECAPLPPSYNLFGVVHAGQDVAARITAGDRMTTVTVAESR